MYVTFLEELILVSRLADEFAAIVYILSRSNDWKTTIEENVYGEKHSYQFQLSHLQGFNFIDKFITIFKSRGFVYKCTDDNLRGYMEEGAAYVVRPILEKSSFIS